MNKKGFTLVELIAVIILISLIATIAIIPISKIIKDSKDDMFENQKEQIILAAQNWGSDNQMLLYTKKMELMERMSLNAEITYDNTPVYILMLNDLIRGEYLDDEIKDVRTDSSNLNGCVKIFFNKESETAKNNTYIYQFKEMEDCN